MSNDKQLPKDIREKIKPKEVSMLDLVLMVRKLEAENFGLKIEIKQQSLQIKELLDKIDELKQSLDDCRDSKLQYKK